MAYHTHSDMRVSRIHLKYAFRQCRANEDIMRADPLAHSLKSKDLTSFWKDVRKMADSKIPLASKVVDAVGSAKITDMWQTHYSELLNSVHDTSSKSFLSEHIDAVSFESIALILAAEHYVYSHKCLSVHLALLFTCISTHEYMPDAFMKTSIIPIVKNKQGDQGRQTQPNSGGVADLT